MGTLQEVCKFFSGSAKRVGFLSTAIETHCPSSSHNKLKTMCETRWVERHDVVIVFIELLPAIFDALEQIQDLPMDISSMKASALHSAISNSQFIVALLVLESVSGLLLPLSKILQATDLDIFMANDLIGDLLSVLKKRREQYENIFKTLFSHAKTLCNQFSIQVKLPRCPSKQTCRDNYPIDGIDNHEKYYRQSVYVPYIDYVISELVERFADQRNRCGSLWGLLPKYLSGTNNEAICNILKVQSAIFLFS
jgi:hypothetical protein